MDTIACLQHNMPDSMEAVWITDEADRFYFTGMKSSAGALLITRTAAWLLIDFRYLEQAQARVKNCTVLEQKDLYAQAAGLLRQAGVKRLSLLTSRVTIRQYHEMACRLEKIELDVSGTLDRLIGSLRAQKSDEEAAWHREAQRITDQTFQHICGFLRPGLTEIEIAQEIGTTLTRLGSDDKTFSFIVASGKNSSLPHGFATRKQVDPSDFITMDFGAVVNGRLADMTRTVALGSVSDEQKKVYEVVLEAQKQAFDIIRPGAVCRDVDAAARRYIYSMGYEGCFSHGLGHSVGVEVHEDPRFHEHCETKLAPGHVMTVEPGIYLKHRFGVRIEDMIRITPDGFENFTKSEKKLMIL